MYTVIYSLWKTYFLLFVFRVDSDYYSQKKKKKKKEEKWLSSFYKNGIDFQYD